MSNSAELTTIEASDLIHINGGGETGGSATVNVPGRGSVTVGGTHRTSGYQDCLEQNRRRSAELHPDNRWFWQRWMGQPDPNAPARIADERRNAASCGAPPT